MRKMAYIAEISNLAEIPKAQKIELATVGGWNVVVWLFKVNWLDPIAKAIFINCLNMIIMCMTFPMRIFCLGHKIQRFFCYNGIMHYKLSYRNERIWKKLLLLADNDVSILYSVLHASRGPLRMERVIADIRSAVALKKENVSSKDLCRDGS